MIAWTIAGAVPPLTGETKVEGSSSSSSSGSASTTNEDALFSSTLDGSASASASSSFVQATTHNFDGSTTYFSGTYNATYTEEWKDTLDLTPAAQANPNNNYSGPTFNTQTFSSSTSYSSSSLTSQQLTALVETSTTETYESGYEVTYTTTVEAYEGQVPIWTTSEDTITIASETKTSVAFYQTYATSFTALQASLQTREATTDATTTLDQTITLSGLPDTIVQAETRYPQNAEILYAITAPVGELTAYSAATNLAQSGTRFTLSPQVFTASKIAADYSRPTSSIASTQQTSLVVVVRSTLTQQVVTGANYNRFPPSTFTTMRLDVATTNTTLATNVLSFQNNLTYGATTNTLTAKSFGDYWKIVSNQIGERSFQTAVVSTTTWTVTLPVEAAATSSTQSGEDYTFAYQIFFGAASGVGQLENATFRSSGVTANTFVPTVKATTGVGGQPSQNKYGTIGAAIGLQKGGWITANASSEGFVAFEWLYALDGNDRRATTMLPVTNQYRTVNAAGITWKTSTNAVMSIDGATSRITTSSASFGVSGATQTTNISQPIGHFGGQAGSQETFVQTANPGAYKNRVNGSTTSFDAAATLLSNGASAPIASWAAIKDIRGLAYTNMATPIVWAEPRNSTALPPAVPPNA